MKFQKYNWIEFCPSIDIRGDMITVEDLPMVREHQGQDKPMFISRYLFDRPSPYTGKVLSNYYADFDSAEDPQRALVELLDLAERFIDMGVDEADLKLRFTGGKGGSLEVPFQYFEAKPSEILPQVWKRISEFLIKSYHYKTIDLSVYDRRRLWRLTNTRHKSGRFKIPLTIDELKANKLEQIREMAQNTRPYEWIEDRDVEVTPVPKLVALLKDAAKEVRKEKKKWKKQLKERNTEFSEERIFPCVKTLIEQGVDAEEFQRNPTAFNIAVALTSIDADDDYILEQLMEFAQNCRPEFPENRYPELKHAIEMAKRHDYATHCGTPCFEAVCVGKKNCWVFSKEGAQEKVVVVKEEFTMDTVAEANEILSNPKILGWVSENALGDVFMENKTKMALFLLQLNYQSVRVSGETSTGKSHVADAVMNCFPKHWWLKYTGATDKFIRHMEGSDYIRTIYFAEFAAVKIGIGEESTAEYDMKMIMSEGSLKTGVVEKVDGKFTSVDKTVSVRNFITTSTDVEMAPELRNRQWEQATDRTINYEFVEFMADRLSTPPWERPNYDRAKLLSRCMLEILDEECPKKWWVPYMRELAVIFKPLSKRTDIRRNIQKLEKFIIGCAKLHYRNRPIVEHEGVKYGMALPQDFYFAWNIGDEAIMGTLTEMTRRMEEVWNSAEEILDANKKLNSQTLSARVGVNQDNAKKWLSRFDDMGLLVGVERTAGGMQYQRSATPSTGQPHGQEVEIPLSILYKKPLLSYMTAEQVQEAKDTFFNKNIRVCFPETVQRFRLEDLPDDLRARAQGIRGSIDVGRMTASQLRVVRGGIY